VKEGRRPSATRSAPRHTSEPDASTTTEANHPTVDSTHRRALSALRPIPRRGLSRAESAIYLGIGTTMFDRLVAEGRMPRPKQIDGRRIWDILALDQAFDLLPDENNGAAEDWTAAL
jgi:predicted DNA-binding transcriptional regulator AlpA